MVRTPPTPNSSHGGEYVRGIYYIGEGITQNTEGEDV